MTSTYRRVGFLVSGLLHAAVAIVFLSQIDNPFEQNAATSPLTLAMFQEIEPPEIIPEPDPVTPPETLPEAEPEKAVPDAKKRVRPPEVKPRPAPVTPDNPVIEHSIESEPDIKFDRGTMAETVPAIEPVREEENTEKTRLSSQYESLKQRYIRVLLKRIHRKKHYPRRARRNREEGEVLVSFVIRQSGDISDIRVSRSSGYVDLDKAAVKTLARVSPLQPLPDELGMTSWELAVPIAFDLRK